VSYDLTPTIEDPVEQQRRRYFPQSKRPRSTDAVANALHDIREAVEDLRMRVDELETRDGEVSESLSSELRDLTDRVDNLESAI